MSKSNSMNSCHYMIQSMFQSMFLCKFHYIQNIYKRMIHNNFLNIILHMPNYIRKDFFHI